MKIKSLIILSCCLSAVIVVLSLLYYTTNLPNQENNGFKRKWLTSNIVPIYNSTSNFPLERISGVTSNSIFFSGKDPRWILMTDTTLKVIDTFYFGVKLTESLRSPSTIVDSPHVYMYASSISYLLTGSLNSSKLDTTKLQTPLFTRFAQISPNRLIIRGFDSLRQKQEFKKIDCLTGQIIKVETLFENQNFGGFEMDGYLQYDPESQKLLFVQMYQNRFFCLDSNLNVVYTAHTIDTTLTNTISIRLVNTSKETKIMPTESRQTVNKGICISNGYLFITSGLRADNESFRTFNQNMPIDIYLIKNGQYIGSFYIPNIKGKKIKSLAISQRLLVALFESNNIVTFMLPLSLGV